MVERGGVTAGGTVAIDTVPLPEAPLADRFEYGDSKLLNDLTAVFEKHGWKGSIVRVEFDSGMVPPRKPDRFCFRLCVFGPDDRLYCTWVCL